MHRFLLAAVMAWHMAAAQSAGAADAARLIQEGKPAAAVPLLEKVLQDTPRDINARNLLGIALSQMGKEQAANEQFQKAVEADPQSIASLRNLGLSDVALGQTAQARGRLEAVLKANPKDPAAHLGMAEIAFSARRFADAVANFRESAGMYLAVPAYTLHYAQSCIEIKQPAAAIEVLKQMPPSADAQAHFEAGVLLARAEQFEAAAEHFKAAEGGLADAYDAGYNLTLAYLKSNQPARAIEAGERLLARGYRKAELYNLLSQAYERAGRTKEAYGALRTATELDPADESNYLDLIALCLDHQNWDLSLEIAGIAVAKLPQSYRLHLQRGAVLAMKTQYDDAAREFQAAAQIAPQAALPVVSLALVQMQMNKLDDAIALLRERRKAAPNDYLVNWFLGEALNRNGVLPGTADEGEAVQALQQAVKTNPKAEQARVVLGKFLLKRGDADGAIEQFTRALQLDPEDSAATYQLAQAYRKRGDSKRAAELFAKVSKEKAEAREQFTQRNLVRIIREGTQ